MKTMTLKTWRLRIGALAALAALALPVAAQEAAASAPEAAASAASAPAAAAAASAASAPEAATVAAAAPATPEEAIRANLPRRMPALPKIDEVRAMPMQGLFEVRTGSDIFYTDAQANYLIRGSLVDTQTRKNLTEERLERLTAIDFDKLNLDNAITIVRGDGSRKLAVFEDPNCPYCKRVEKSLAEIENVTVHVFVAPLLGKNSAERAQKIWCAADKAKTWMDWMLSNTAPEGNASCDTTALDENMAFAREHRISGVPALIFADGSRVAGAIGTDKIKERLERK